MVMAMAMMTMIMTSVQSIEDDSKIPTAAF